MGPHRDVLAKRAQKALCGFLVAERNHEELWILPIQVVVMDGVRAPAGAGPQLHLKQE